MNDTNLAGMALIFASVAVFISTVSLVGIVLAFVTDWDDRLGKRNEDRDRAASPNASARRIRRNK